MKDYSMALLYFEKAEGEGEGVVKETLTLTPPSLSR